MLPVSPITQDEPRLGAISNFCMAHGNTAGIILYRDYLYGNLYQMPILYVEIDIQL
jgi:hypothetical protein